MLLNSRTSQIYAWGDNTQMQLGLNRGEDYITKPQILPFKQAVSAMSCGADHTLCLTTTGKVYQWGRYYKYSDKGAQIKTGTAPEPKLVNELQAWIISIAAGTGHNLALTETKELYSWGNGLQG